MPTLYKDPTRVYNDKKKFVLSPRYCRKCLLKYWFEYVTFKFRIGSYTPVCNNCDSYLFYLKR